MRLLEILLVLSSFTLFINVLLLKKIDRKMTILTALISTGVLALHLILEGYRWQLFFIYLFSVLFIIRLLCSKKNGIQIWKPVLYLYHTVVLFFMIVSTCLAAYMPVNPLPKHEGKYKIGTQTLHLTDKKRDETFTKKDDDVRELMVQVWYPAHNTNRNEPTFLFSQDDKTFQKYKEAYANELRMPSFLFDYLKYIQTNSYKDALIVPSQDPFPVVLLSHGLGTSRHLHVSQAEHLASHGYIVVAIDHTYIAAGSAFPDGRFSPFQADDFEKKFFEMDNTYGDMLVNDMDSVIDYLQQLHTGKIQSSFKGKLDLENIGIMGHSFGGAAAFHAVQENSNIKAGINMDGTLYPIDQTNNIQKPFLFIEDEDFFSFRKKFEQGRLPSSTFSKKQLQQLKIIKTREYEMIDHTIDSGGKLISIEGARHFNFTDLQLFSNLFSPLGLTGEIDGKRSSFIVNQYVLDFFDEHLKGQTKKKKTHFKEITTYEKAAN